MINQEFLYLFCACFLLLHCKKSDDVDQPLQSADYYFEKATNYRQGSAISEMYLDSVLLVDPNHAEAWFEKAAWQIKTGNYIKYFDYMEQASAIEPGEYLGWRGAIKLYYLHDFDGALNDFFALKKVYPDRNDISTRGENLDHLIGTAYWQKGEYEKAIRYFDQSINNNVHGEEWVAPYTFIRKGICYLQLNHLKQAEKTLLKALKQCPNCVDAHYYLAKTYQQQEEKQKAVKHIDLAIERANNGYIKTDAYRDVLDQRYHSDLTSLKEQLEMEGSE